MNASDPFIEAYVAGLDLAALHLSVAASGAAIGLSPLAKVMPSQSVILHCKRHRNIDRLVAVIRSEIENAPTSVALSQLVSAVVNLAGTLGITILTETEVLTAAVDAVANMETELATLQCGSGLSAINRSVRRDAAAAQAPWAAIFSRLGGGGRGPWHHHIETLHRPIVAALTTGEVIIRTRLANTARQFAELVFRWASRSERLTIFLLRYLSVSMGRAAERMAHRRRFYDR
jgi:hypothetical protein